MPFIQPDFSEVQKGPCYLTFGGYFPGDTEEGITVNYNTDWEGQSTEESGEYDDVKTGESIAVEMQLTFSTFRNLIEFTKAKEVVDAADATKKYVAWGGNLGESNRANAKKLVLHPRHLAESDKSKDLVIFLAAPQPQLRYAYSRAGKQVIVVTVKGYKDFTRAQGEQLFLIGDETAIA